MRIILVQINLLLVFTVIEQENDPRTKRLEIRFYVKKSDFYEYQKMADYLYEQEC